MNGSGANEVVTGDARLTGVADVISMVWGTTFSLSSDMGQDVPSLVDEIDAKGGIIAVVMTVSVVPCSSMSECEMCGNVDVGTVDLITATLDPGVPALADEFLCLPA